RPRGSGSTDRGFLRGSCVDPRLGHAGADAAAEDFADPQKHHADRAFLLALLAGHLDRGPALEVVVLDEGGTVFGKLLEAQLQRAEGLVAIGQTRAVLFERVGQPPAERLLEDFRFPGAAAGLVADVHEGDVAGDADQPDAEARFAAITREA